MALAIALIVLLLISIMMLDCVADDGDQKLGGNNADRQRASMVRKPVWSR